MARLWVGMEMANFASYVAMTILILVLWCVYGDAKGFSLLVKDLGGYGFIMTVIAGMPAMSLAKGAGTAGLLAGVIM